MTSCAHRLPTAAARRRAGCAPLSDPAAGADEGRPGDAGPLAGYVTDARQQVASFASVGDRGIEGVCRRRLPVRAAPSRVFLLAAAGAGFVVGRFVRSGVSVARDSSPNGDSDRDDDVDDPDYANDANERRTMAHALTLPSPSSADDRDAGAVTVDRGDIDLAVEPKRPEASLGELFSEMTQNLGTLFRQEVELAKTEAKEEAAAAGKASAMFVVGGRRRGAGLGVPVCRVGVAPRQRDGFRARLRPRRAAWLLIAAVLVVSRPAPAVADQDPAPDQAEHQGGRGMRQSAEELRYEIADTRASSADARCDRRPRQSRDG